MSKDEQRLTWMAIDDTYCVSPEEERKILDRINKKIESNFEFKKREEATDKYLRDHNIIQSIHRIIVGAIFMAFFPCLQA